MQKRNTIQRVFILDSVRRLANHPTADEIYQDVALLHPHISKGTVYRNLHSLCDNGEVRRVSVPDAADRFDFRLEPHYHIACNHCGSFVDMNLPYMAQVDHLVEKDTGYRMEGHDIVFRGICPKCMSIH